MRGFAVGTLFKHLVGNTVPTKEEVLLTKSLFRTVKDVARENSYYWKKDESYYTIFLVLLQGLVNPTLPIRKSSSR